MIALVRVDNRLIHGQVVSTWIPFVKADQVIVADEEAARSTLMKAAMTMAVPPSLDVAIERPGEIDWAELERSPRRVLVLVRDVSDAEAAMKAGLPLRLLNLGNVHFGEGRRAVSPSIFLSDAELAVLRRLADQGVAVEARALPTDPAVALAEIRARHEAAS